MNMKKVAQACAVAGATLLAGQAYAANWLMLQGTEPAGSAGRAKVWGFIQAQYQKDFSDANAGPAGCGTDPTSTAAPPGNLYRDCYIPPKLIGPDLTSQSAFNVNRARIGVRGANLPLDANTNYFILVEFGNNALTNSKGSYAPRLSDASITLNHIPGARVRLGLFKYPGSEEGMQGIGTLDYVNFTEVTNQLMLERFQSAHSASAVTVPGALPLPMPGNASLSQYDRPVGAFRDVGIQVFDSFMASGLEHSYAVMIGNGNGVNFTDDNDKKDLYVYWSTAKIFGGKGPKREDVKGFAWYQTGKRTWDDGTGSKDYNRKRWGVGVRYFKKPFRATAEYLAGKGMIFNGPDKPNWGLASPLATHPSNGLTAKGKGYYAEVGYYVPHTKWELDARYDYYARLDGSMFELDWKAYTLGVQYHLNKKTKITANYAFRDVEAKNFASGAGPNANLDGIDDRASIQVTAVY